MKRFSVKDLKPFTDVYVIWKSGLRATRHQTNDGVKTLCGIKTGGMKSQPKLDSRFDFGGGSSLPITNCDMCVLAGKKQS